METKWTTVGADGFVKDKVHLTNEEWENIYRVAAHPFTGQAIVRLLGKEDELPKS